MGKLIFTSIWGMTGIEKKCEDEEEKGQRKGWFVHNLKGKFVLRWKNGSWGI